MACKKYNIVNSGGSAIYFNYQRCNDSIWEYQESLMPGESKNLWVIPGTFSSPFNTSNFQLTDEGVFPPVPLSPTPSKSPVTPTPTPTNTETPTPTPTNTETPTQTPTQTNTETPTQTPTQTQTPTNTETPTQTPTQTTTQTPSPTPPPPFISIWTTSTNGDTVTLPLESTGTYSFTVDWGDGSMLDIIMAWDDMAVTHTYTTQGTYTVTIHGTINGFTFNNGGDCLKLIEITQWGSLKLGNSGGYFYGCNNLILSSVVDTLNLVGTTNLSNMFTNCYSLSTIQNISNWDVSNVQNMYWMFTNASSFNSDISNWIVSGVTNMSHMFSSTPYNNPLSGWNVSNVQNMSSMFSSSFFDSDISGWDVSNVQDMSSMFSYSQFNQSINNWGTRLGNVTNMSGMFDTAYNFNQPLDNWNVQYVQDMNNMFANETQFNLPLSAWNVGYCTNFTGFMSGKDSTNYSTQNISTLLQSWSSQGLQPSVVLDLGNIDILDTDLSYISTLQGKGWTVIYGNVIYTYSAGYDVSNPTNACSATPSIYYSSASTLSNLGYIFTDTTYTTPAPNGVYCLTCPNNSGIETFSINSSLANPGQLFSVTTCP